ncbi:MAG TPA: gas vesicle protein GvpJ [Nocardioides sp.]|uniref:gas vesicle protein GvpJ n=1 Tax=Nocardioides sp. TaxID=35761 RepID=UPI002E33A1F9|nr:gas vesicle protein GvpJ [Nocardioides sp.]HEX5086836.1 gas vesicle protein GvpJ [Nocardioides sp.]
MTVQTSSRRSGGGYLERPAPSGLADVVETILDKGIVIDAYVRVSLVGIELLTVDARIVIASVDTYLRFAEATNRLDLYEKGGKDLTEAIGDLQETGAAKKVGGAVKGVKKAITGGDDEDDDEDENERPRRRSSSRSSSRRRESSRG